MDVDTSIIDDLAGELPQFEAAVRQLRPGEPASLAVLDPLWEKYRFAVQAFSQAAYGARVRTLQDASIEEANLFAALKTYKLAFTAYGAVLLLWLLNELAWASRIVDRLRMSEHNRALADTDALTAWRIGGRLIVS